MAILKLKLRELEGARLSVPTDEPHLVVAHRVGAVRLEIADVHYNTDSAVLLPDGGPEQPSGAVEPAITGLAVLRACLEYARDNPGRLALVTGHTDAAGTPGYNLGLSTLRAKNFKAALVGKRDDWVETALGKSCVADQQRILQHVAATMGWGCDPGGVDDKPGPHTRRAVVAFQRAYNAEWSANLATDGAVGRQTWGAFFDVYMRQLRTALDVDDAGLAALQAGVTFLPSSAGCVGCGSTQPVEKGGDFPYRSANDRRVEALFFDPGDPPKLACHPGPDTCLPAVCPVYRGQHYDFDPLPVGADRIVSIRLLDEAYDPCKATPFTMYLPTGVTYQGVTNDDGWLHRMLPDSVTQVDVEYAAGPMSKVRITAMLHIGHDDAAYQAQIDNLGFADVAPDTALRIAAFQRATEKLDVTGKLDPPTRAALDDMQNSDVAPYFDPDG
jgi:peptidoglycan hydrolase-like protein with peptidoglycan-binding domain